MLGKCRVPAFLKKPARLAGNVLMAVQDHLRGEGRMAADLDRQMAPVAIANVKGMVVDVKPPRRRPGGAGVFLSMWWAPTVQTTAGARPTRTRNSPG